MSNGFYDRFGTSIGTSNRRSSQPLKSKEGCEVYVSGLPVDLDNYGLENIFIKAGKIESARVIPPKNPVHSTTYGFVTFANRTAAATAIETFNNFKFGSGFLKVRYTVESGNISSSTSNSSSVFLTPANSNTQVDRDNDLDRDTQPRKSTNTSLDVSVINESTIRESSIHTLDELSKIKGTGQGVLTSVDYKKMIFDITRPYAKKLYEQKVEQFGKIKSPSSTNQEMVSKNKSILRNEELASEQPKQQKPINISRLEIGKSYPINITHVNSPDNFFVELKSSLTTKANLMNNLDNYYRNKLSSNDLLDDDWLELNDLCAGYLVDEDFWFRGRILFKSLTKRVYRLSLLDFGDIHEVAFVNVKLLDEEFSSCESTAIRCKLHSIQPPDCKAWSPKVIELFNSLKQDDKDLLEAFIYACDDVEIDDHIEKLYSIDIVFSGDDSVIDYLITNELAIEKNEDDVNEQYDFERTHKFENNFPNPNQFDQTVELIDELDESLDEAINMYRSVSQKDLHTSYAVDQFISLKQLAHLHERKGLFNSTFRVWKKKDLRGFVQTYKIGQSANVIISYIDDSRRFYIQDEKRIDDLKHLENCLSKFAHTLLSDPNIRNELEAYQTKTTKFDVVLIKAAWDQMWHRAVYLEKMSSKDFNDQVDEEELNGYIFKNDKSYHSVFLIDYGREDLIITKNNDPNREIFILPLIDSKLIDIGPFALKCCINESYIKKRGLIVNEKDAELRIKNEVLFEKCFKEMLLNKRVEVRVSQMNPGKAESEAIVELFYHEKDVEQLVKSLNGLNLIHDENLIDMNAKNNQFYLKLNCIHYVMKKMFSLNEMGFEPVSVITDEVKVVETKFTPPSPPSSISSNTSTARSATSKSAADTTQSTVLKERNLNIVEQKPIKTTNQQECLLKPTQAIQKPISSAKLNLNQIYTVTLQYFDESFTDQYFFLILKENLTQLDQLDTLLQSTSNESVQYVNSIQDLKIGETFEALFDVDLKWYRVKLTNLTSNSLTIYFLDFGNTQTLNHQDVLENKILRRRLNKNLPLFQLEYQAIKCCYEKEGKLCLDEFISQLTQIPNADTGFDIIVNQVNTSNNVYTVQLFDLKTPTSAEMKQTPVMILEDQDIDDVFSTSINLNQQMCSILTMSEDEIGLSLDMSKRHQSVITFVQTSNEFYVQPNSNLKQIIDHQLRVQKLADVCIALEFKSLKGQPNYQIGDVCIAKNCDSTWYRAVVIDIKQTNDNEYLYDVFFPDYGNTDKNLTDSFMYSINAIKNAIKNTKKSLENELKEVIEFPFQAICCRLHERKDSSRNTEVLKTQVSACSNFSISIRESKKHYLSDHIWIKQYVVNLYSDERLLDNEFESEQTTNSVTSIKLKDLTQGETYAYKLSNFASETELFVHLIDDLDALNQLENEISKSVNEINKSSMSSTKFKVNDLVLAKFYEDDNLFNWYRARINGLNGDLYQVVYVDYGNTDASLTHADLRPLPIKLAQEAQFAYNIRLYEVPSLNVDLNESIIAEYVSSLDYKLRVVKKENDYYLVELWNQDMTQCLNKLLNEKYTSPFETNPIAFHTLNDLFSQKQPQQIRTKYMFIEDFKRPFYFCLEQDMLERDELTLKLNEYYAEAINLDLIQPKVNDYCAIYSENAWYRCQVKSINENKIHVFFIDYGYEETVETIDKLKRLVDSFMKVPRFIFGAYLLEPNSEKKIEFTPSDDTDLTPCLETFFTGDDELDLIVKTKIEHDIQYENEYYFGIEILNKLGLNLNKIIVDAKKDLESKRTTSPVKKPKMPNYIRLSMSDIPEQVKPIHTESDDHFLIYNKDEIVYLFEEKKVVTMQKSVQEICAKIAEEKEQYEDDILQLPAKGDLVYAKYEDDLNWYRCLITNCNQVRNKYELFFIDFGNTEINSKEDILYGFTQEHIKPFKENAAIAYKTKLV